MSRLSCSTRARTARRASASRSCRSQGTREVHPELCFTEANAGVPMTHSKKKAAGRSERVSLLVRLGFLTAPPPRPEGPDGRERGRPPRRMHRLLDRGARRVGNGDRHAERTPDRLPRPPHGAGDDRRHAPARADSGARERNFAQDRYPTALRAKSAVLMNGHVGSKASTTAHPRFAGHSQIASGHRQIAL